MPPALCLQGELFEAESAFLVNVHATPIVQPCQTAAVPVRNELHTHVLMQGPVEPGGVRCPMSPETPCSLLALLLCFFLSNAAAVGSGVSWDWG